MSKFIKNQISIFTNILQFVCTRKKADKIEPAKKPRVSIITSIYKGDLFIESFMQDITRQTIFKDCELILINANSPGSEELVIKKYEKKFPNIVYKKLDKDPGLYGVWNLAIKMAKSDYITNANLDDRRAIDCLEVHAKSLDENPDIDLVFSNFIRTLFPNETFENYTFYNRTVFTEYTVELMKEICMPGPAPMWRKSMHEKAGYFDEKEYKIGADFEMWLRAVSKGSKFKFVPGYYCLYFENPTGISTDPKKASAKDFEHDSVVKKYSFLGSANDQKK